MSLWIVVYVDGALRIAGAVVYQPEWATECPARSLCTRVGTHGRGTPKTRRPPPQSLRPPTPPHPRAKPAVPHAANTMSLTRKLGEMGWLGQVCCLWRPAVQAFILACPPPPRVSAPLFVLSRHSPPKLCRPLCVEGGLRICRPCPGCCLATFSISNKAGCAFTCTVGRGAVLCPPQHGRRLSRPPCYVPLAIHGHGKGFDSPAGQLNPRYLLGWCTF